MIARVVKRTAEHYVCLSCGQTLPLTESPGQWRCACLPVKVGAPARGPGTELKKLLARVGITAAESCGCSAKAKIMDSRGCDWCEANVGVIVGWLRAEAEKRRLPFIDLLGNVLVRRAIRNARKEQARAEATEGKRKGGSPAV